MRLNKYILFLSILLLLPAFKSFSQQGAGNPGYTEPRKSVVSEFIAKPAYETTSGGMHYKVWIMSAIKGLKDTEIKKNEYSDDDDVPRETHHVMIEIVDPLNGYTISDAMVQLKSVSPSGKESTLELDPMMAQYGGNLSFGEKGDYQMNISVTSGGRAMLTPFTYTVN
jgi:hypothetical protein